MFFGWIHADGGGLPSLQDQLHRRDRRDNGIALVLELLARWLEVDHIIKPLISGGKGQGHTRATSRCKHQAQFAPDTDIVALCVPENRTQLTHREDVLVTLRPQLFVDRRDLRSNDPLLALGIIESSSQVFNIPLRRMPAYAFRGVPVRLAVPGDFP